MCFWYHGSKARILKEELAEIKLAADTDTDEYGKDSSAKVGEVEEVQAVNSVDEELNWGLEQCAGSSSNVTRGTVAVTSSEESSLTDSIALCNFVVLYRNWNLFFIWFLVISGFPCIVQLKC
jgi:hypothetical protein